MILQSLPESFNEFRLNYNMNKKIYSLSELMNELVATEDILGTSSVDVNMVETSTSQPKSKGKGKKKNKKKKKKKKKKDFTKQGGKKIALEVANKGKKKDYAKGKCFHYGKKGYWKRRMLAAKFFSSSHDEDQEAPWSQNPVVYKHSSFFKRKMN